MATPLSDERPIWLVAGVRIPFVGVDGPFARRDSLTLSVPVAQAMAQRVNGPIDFGVLSGQRGDLASVFMFP
jgi:hypothetical protein